MAAGRAARLMKSSDKQPAGEGEKPSLRRGSGRQSIRKNDPTPQRATTSKKLAVRREGWDEHLVVGLAFALAAVVAVVAIYQTIAWVWG